MRRCARPIGNAQIDARRRSEERRDALGERRGKHEIGVLDGPGLVVGRQAERAGNVVPDARVIDPMHDEQRLRGYDPSKQRKDGETPPRRTNAFDERQYRLFG